ncbi:hypothetical protein EV356DRAFT_529857 [Viridothelium virens]|uniref:Large ribosomal subunit protein mL59 domain-containing protein n=1 Tax=Viridothelium virens TaxID=1048519 RepID=A0A6A6HI61_VIRVR|nr:hypothetical protein EV356DRAFT_529857 [Viridothelium virens]
MAVAIREQHIAQARALPRRLLNFLRHNPHPTIVAQPAPSSSQSEAVETAETTSLSDPNASMTTIHATRSVSSDPWAVFNPFRPWKNPETGRWHEPVYSLRKQADLVKMARQRGLEDLLPPGMKSTTERERRTVEQGLRVKGTGAGQKVKGKLWERTIKGRLERRRQAMLDMPRMIEKWKQLGHGRGWTKWPK